MAVNTKNTLDSHNNEFNKYNLTINTKSSLRQQVVSRIDNDYIMGLRNNNTGFDGVFTWIMMDYLYTNHGNIEYEDVVANKYCLTNPFDPTQPIYNLLNFYKEISTIYTKGGKPISSQGNISSSYILIKTSGAYNRAIEYWDDMAETQKNCLVSKKFYHGIP